MSSFEWPPSGGSGIPAYSTLSAFPSASAYTGTLAIALNTGDVYESFGGSWVLVGGPGVALSIGTIDSEGSASANGATISASSLILQSASGTAPGLVNTTTQTFAGQKTFSTGLTGTLTGSASLNLLLTGGTLSGALNMGSNRINALEDPSSAQDAATKNYVDASVAALNPYEACYCATTANVVGTYVSVGAGVGDTFTATATGQLTIDGQTPGLNARVLIKNQSSGYQNGIYTITTAGTTGVSTVFTRAADYNTPADVNGAGLIPIINGTSNALSSWQQTANVVSIGPAGTALTFAEFTANPSLYLLKANNLSDVGSASTAFNNISPITTTGDLIVGSGTSTASRLAIGSTSQALIVSGGTAAWGTLPVLGGGTGLTTTTQYGLYVGGSSTLAQLAVPSSGTLLQGVASGNPAFTATPTLGVNGTTTGSIAIATATTSGASVTITQSAASGATTAYSLVLPTTVGTSGYVLTSSGSSSSPMTWSSVLTNPMTTVGDIIYGGTAGAATRLAGNTSTTPNFYTSTGSGSAALAPTLTSSTGTGSVVLSAAPTLTGNTTASQITLTGSNNALYIDPATATAAGYIEVTNTGGTSYFGVDNSTGGQFGQGNYTTVVFAPGVLSLSSGGSQAVKFDASQNATYPGTATWSQSLNGSVYQGITISNTSNTSGSDSCLEIVTRTSGGSPYTLYSGGGNTWSVGQDITNSNAFTIADGTGLGSNRYLTISTGNVVTLSSLAGSGSRAVNASAVGALSASSDSSLKVEDKTATIPGLDEVMKLQPRAYRWKEDIKNRGDKAATEIGFFADEVAPIIPSAAPKCSDGLYGFYDRSVTAALVKAIQELKADYDAYKASHP